MKKIIFLSLAMLATKAMALSIDWTGGYRIEYTEIDRPSLAESKERKAYGLNFLYLQPKILASDGIVINSRFDVFSNTHRAYKNSQLGSVFGSGLSSYDGTNNASNGNNVNSETSDSSILRVSQLYLTVNNEFGNFVVGRAPFEFGLGITHNAGKGAFDHWYDTQDLISYRFIVDNISFTPIWSRVAQKDFGQGVTISDQMFVFEYDNKEIGAKAGVLHQTRRSSYESNDGLTPGFAIPIAGVAPGAASLSGSWATQTINLFFGRSWEAFQFKLEASFLTGDSGYLVAGSQVKINAYAVAAEMVLPAQGEAKWEYSAKFGVASGDDPKTTNVIEGYQMDRNYDVAMLLFNHRMGQKDFLTTGMIHTDSTLNVGNSADDEAIGNVFYVAPTAKYQWNEKVDVKSTLIFGQLMTNPYNSVDFSKDLGTELDVEVIYKPRERVTWSNEIGILMPGKAWKDGASGLDNKLNFGLATKAAITF